MAHRLDTSQRARRHHDIERAHDIDRAQRRYRANRHAHITHPDLQARAHGLSWLSL